MEARQPLPDLIFQTASIALAVVSALFAGLMIFRLETLKPEPEAAMPIADPIVTGSLAEPRAAASDFRLLTVIDGTAFVEVNSGTGAEIWPVGLGSRLPGVGKIARIDRTGGRWRLAAGRLTLVQDPQ